MKVSEEDKRWKAGKEYGEPKENIDGTICDE